MLSMVLVLLLAWLVLSVLFAALFALLARRIRREETDWDRELRDLTRGAGPSPLTTVATSQASGGARRRRGPSPRRGPEGMAEFRG